MAAVDLQGKSFEVGQKVVKGQSLFNILVICYVTKVDGGKVYLDNSRQPMKCPERLCIIS